jgi:type IV pilus assembly protein PilB
MSLIGKLLVKNGIITESQLAEALSMQEESKKRLGELLISLGYLKAKDLMWMLSEQADISFVELKPEMLDSPLIGRFPEKLLIDNNILPLYETEAEIYVVIGDPTKKELIQSLQQYTVKRIVVSAAEPGKIHTLLSKFYMEHSLEETLKKAQKDGNELRIKNLLTTIEFIDKEGNTKSARAKVNMQIRIEEWPGGADE